MLAPAPRRRPCTSAAEAFALVAGPPPEVRRRHDLSRWVGVHLHHKDLPGTPGEGESLARRQLSDFSGCTAWAGARCEDLGADLGIGVRCDCDGSVGRRGQTEDRGAAVADVRRGVADRRAARRPERRVGAAVPERLIPKPLRHQVLGFRRSPRCVGDALRGKRHAEVQQCVSESIVGVLHAQVQRDKRCRAAQTQAAQEVVVGHAAPWHVGLFEGLVVLQRAGGGIPQQSVLREVRQEHGMDLVELA
mmetsp:Transcript_88433/g.274933  ORF Transcript_88433/g.274933 Transcript_88433/m.274933 type:complete len:248 (+) Transcript_88433:425-1168(+)